MKKRLGLLVGATTALFIFTSCGNSAQDEFVSYLESQSKITEGTYDFKVAIKDLELPETPDQAANPMAGMIATQLKDMSITGEVQSNTKKDNAFAMNMKINALGMEVPFNMVGSFGKEPKMYMATDIMEYIMGIVGSMTGVDVTAETDLSQLKGKYIDVFAMDETMDQATWSDMVKEMEQAQKNQEEMNKKYITFIKGLDKKSFTKKDDVISHTFTEKEFADLIKTLGDDVSTKDIENIFKDFEKFKVTFDVNTKKDKTNATIDMAPKAADAETTGFSSLVLSFETTLKDKKANITFPKKESILTNDELNTLFPEAAVPGLTTSLNDDEFKELKDALVEGKEFIDETTSKELLDTYKTVLTDAQYKEIEDILKK